MGGLEEGAAAAAVHPILLLYPPLPPPRPHFPPLRGGVERRPRRGSILERWALPLFPPTLHPPPNSPHSRRIVVSLVLELQALPPLPVVKGIRIRCVPSPSSTPTLVNEVVVVAVEWLLRLPHHQEGMEKEPKRKKMAAPPPPPPLPSQHLFLFHLPRTSTTIPLHPLPLPLQTLCGTTLLPLHRLASRAEIRCACAEPGPPPVAFSPANLRPRIPTRAVIILCSITVVVWPERLAGVWRRTSLATTREIHVAPHPLRKREEKPNGVVVMVLRGQWW